jgi:tripartite-type tricarboxylate transporter receptor subunit TctC
MNNKSKNEPGNGMRRKLVLGAAAGTALAALPGGAIAQGLSKRPVRVIVAQTPGTGPDIIARLLTPRLSQRWDQPFIVENHAGASGAIGADMVAKAAPDGHVMMVNVATMFIFPHLYQKLNFDVVKSFQTITHVASTSLALAVHTSVPVNNLKEFIAYVKARPGQLHYGSPGNGTHHHLCMELLKLQAGLDIVHVPYKGSGGATNDLLGGQIPMMFLPIHVALPMQRAGRIKLLGESLRERHPLFPDLPSIAEQGLKDFDVDLWFGVWGPAGLPADIVGRYNKELQGIINSAEMKEKFAEQGLVPKTSTPQELHRIAQGEYDRWGKVVKQANIKFD